MNPTAYADSPRSPDPEIGAVNAGRKLIPFRRSKLTPHGQVSSLVDPGTRPRSRSFEPVGVALDGDDLGVVDESVDHGGGDDGVAEDLAPAAEGVVGGDDQAGSFVAGRDELEAQFWRPRLRRGCSRPRGSHVVALLDQHLTEPHCGPSCGRSLRPPGTFTCPAVRHRRRGRVRHSVAAPAIEHLLQRCTGARRAPVQTGSARSAMRCPPRPPTQGSRAIRNDEFVSHS